MAVRIEKLDHKGGPKRICLIADTDGGVQYITTRELFSGVMQLGPSFQLGKEGSCIVSGTLYDADLACRQDPKIQAIIPWDTTYIGALSPTVITTDSDIRLCTALKFEISGPAVVNIITY